MTLMVKVLPRGLSSKESACDIGDVRNRGLIPGSGRPPGGGNGNPFQSSCLENPMDRGAWGLQSMGSQRIRHDWACMHADGGCCWIKDFCNLKNISAHMSAAGLLGRQCWVEEKHRCYSQLRYAWWDVYSLPLWSWPSLSKPLFPHL